MSSNYLLFTVTMKKNKRSTFKGFLILIFLMLVNSCAQKEEEAFSEVVKIALRDAGNKLLLSNQDSTSLILPITKLEPLKFKLSFNEPLSFEPQNLESIISRSFKKAALPEQYRVEVLQCIDGEVAYSYLKTPVEETTIIPCAGRHLPGSCYMIEVKFTHEVASLIYKRKLFYLYVFGVLFLLGLYFYKKKQVSAFSDNDETYALGSFKFYPEQNKLVKQAMEISLSRKECELLAIFVANPNQIIKRDELTKKVWEDNGVIVGRSLDTYISKLRKILKDDASIKLTNVHGVGYKLEI
jgi:hypothetical protein